MTAVRLVSTAVAAALALAIAAGIAQAKSAPHPYKLVDPGTLGGPQSFLNLPGVPITPAGALIGTADTDTRDDDAPNFNPFVIGFPDPFTARAFSWQNGGMTDLGALPGNNSSAVFQVNRRGVGAGLSETGETDPALGWPAMHAVTYEGGRVTDLGTLRGGTESLAFAINDRSQVAGFGNNDVEDPWGFFYFDGDAFQTQTHSFIWQHGVMTDIGTLGGPDAVLSALNSRGQISGTSFTGSAPNETTGIPTVDPFIWEDGRMRDLGTLGGTISFVSGMNDAGQVAGFSTFGGDESGDAVLWDGKRMRDLGTLGGDFSFANAVNGAGHVTGIASLPDGTTHAFLWADGKMRDLPPVEGAPCSSGFAINDDDDVVGVADDCEGNELAAVLWHKGVPYDLSALIGPTDLTLGEFEYINDDGAIVGRAVLPNGDEHVVMLVPEPGGRMAVAGIRPQPVKSLSRIKATADSCTTLPRASIRALRCVGR